MSEQQSDKCAWVWYDTATLSLKHVGFNPNSDYGPDYDKIEIDYNSALDIMSGKSRLFEYELVKVDDQITLRYKRQQPAVRKFWQLVDPEIAKFNSNFNLADSNTSPLVIKDRTATGFVVDVKNMAKNIVFYITMKNDPNYLIQKIDLYPHAFNAASTTDIAIPVDVQGDYSIYVRYDAA